MTKQKGFTLIELLVVVAIIGILAAVVLTSLGTARTKAKNAAIVAQMSSMRAEAELGVTSAGAYPLTAAFCGGTVGNTLYALLAGVTAQGATAVTCHSTASAWGVAATLVGSNGHYCVDSAGYSGVSTVVPGTEIDTTTSDYKCNNA